MVREGMRGNDQQQNHIFSYLSPEARVRKDHPLRAIRAMVELDMTNALRPGELFALRRQCFNHAECTMRLVETVYKGKIRPWGKTRKSLGVVHVPKN
jgi:hypothetical protein